MVIKRFDGKICIIPESTKELEYLIDISENAANILMKLSIEKQFVDGYLKRVLSFEEIKT